MGASLESAMAAGMPCFHGGGGSAACWAWSLAAAVATRSPTTPIRTASLGIEMHVLCMTGDSLGIGLAPFARGALRQSTPGAQARPWAMPSWDGTTGLANISIARAPTARQL